MNPQRPDHSSAEILSERLPELYTLFKLPHYPHPLLLSPRWRRRGPPPKRPGKRLQGDYNEEGSPRMVAEVPTCLQQSPPLPGEEATSGPGSAPARGEESPDDAQGRADLPRRRDANPDQPVPPDRRALSRPGAWLPVHARAGGAAEPDR